MKVTFKELWTEASQKIDTTVGKNLILNKKTAEIFKAALTAFALIGIFFARLFGHRTESSVGNHSISSPSPAVISVLHPVNEKIQERLRSNVADAQEQQKTEEEKGFEIAIGDIPEALTHLESPLSSAPTNFEGFSVGSAGCQGIRETMEDAELVTEGIHATPSGQFPFKLFGIFDGHSKDGHDGIKAAQFVGSNFSSYLCSKLTLTCKENLSDEGIFKALKECCKQLDADYKGKGGCTGTIALVINNSLWVANVGDSRTIFVKEDGAIVQASHDAKPSDEAYQARIHQLGGQVINGRVNNDLAVARSFGDHDIIGKDGICCVAPNPKITKFDADFKYLILACDGLYDVATTNEVGAAVKEMHAEDKDPEEMAKRLIHSAVRMGTQDNVSVIVVRNTKG